MIYLCLLILLDHLDANFVNSKFIMAPIFLLLQSFDQSLSSVVIYLYLGWKGLGRVKDRFRGRGRIWMDFLLGNLLWCFFKYWLLWNKFDTFDIHEVWIYHFGRINLLHILNFTSFLRNADLLSKPLNFKILLIWILLPLFVRLFCGMLRVLLPFNLLIIDRWSLSWWIFLCFLSLKILLISLFSLLKLFESPIIWWNIYILSFLKSVDLSLITNFLHFSIRKTLF